MWFSRALTLFNFNGGFCVGEVGIIYKVTPESVELDLKVLQKNIVKSLSKSSIKHKINKIEEKPIAFGLKALEIQIVLDDKSGGSEELEGLLQATKGVQSVDVVQMGLL